MKTAYFDGSCTPINPGGDMGWGAVIKDETGKNLFEFSGHKEAAFYATFGRDLGQESTCGNCQW